VARDGRNQDATLATSRTVAPDAIPRTTGLEPAVPNPFRQAVTLAFALAHRCNAELALYAIDGRRVRTLARGALGPGRFRLLWDGRDEAGNASAAGVYYVRLTAGGAKFTRRLTLLR
jgi:hypothetical protein